MQALLDILFKLAGSMVWWAEIISALAGLAAAIWSSWKVYQVTNSGKAFRVTRGLLPIPAHR